MSVSSTLRAYDDCIEIFNRALRTKAGHWIEAPTNGDAHHLKTRLNYCRQLLRFQSMEIYPPGEPEYGISPYEELSVSVKDTRVIIKRRASLDWPSGEIEAPPESGDTSAT